MGNQNKSLSSQEVADILHVSRSTIYELIRRGDIRSYRVGRKVRFTQDDVDAYIARSRHEHQAPLTEKAEVASELLASEKKSAGSSSAVRMWFWIFWPAKWPSAGTGQGAAISQALRGSWPFTRAVWMWWPAISMTELATTPPLCVR